MTANHRVVSIIFVLFASAASGMRIGASALWPASRAHRTTVAMLSDDSGDPSEYQLDWDKAWSAEKERREQGGGVWRPDGREPVSGAALREARLKNAADNAQATLSVWSGDWKLWVGVIAALSVATTLLSHSDTTHGYAV
mmetsp:Transcript_65851/g.130535  ORF Transcript_65851/g.130535 Transcript_65851/m.130535 type:complete len:140 (-) Transcript_65851:310-729(-)